MNFLAMVLARILESKTGNAGRRFFRDDLQALDDPWNDFVLDPGIQAFCVLAEDDEVNVRIARRYMRQVGDRPEICEQLKPFAQFDVNAGKAAADGRSHRTLQSDAGALDRLGEFPGNVLFVFFES